MAGNRPIGYKATLVNEEHTMALADFCQSCGISVEVVYEMVEYGVLDPSGGRREDWMFSNVSLAQARRAMRLRRDLGLNWPGVALAIALLEELEHLRQRQRALLRRLEG